MSSHRNLNVSQFIANLNSLEPVEFGENQQSHEEELSIFSNTTFFDCDMGRSTNIAATVDDLLMQQEKQLQNPKGKGSNFEGGTSSKNANSLVPLEFDTLQQFSLAGELPIFNNGENHSHGHTGGTSNSDALRDQLSVGEAMSSLSSISATPTHEQSYFQSINTPEDMESSSAAATNDIKKRPFSHSSVSGVTVNSDISSGCSSSNGYLDTNDKSSSNSGVSAEEDKRRRNTAASARFRKKKKLREQEMERTTREMQEKIHQLETKVTQLQMENKWLKNLVVEKNEARDVSELLNLKKKIISSADPLVKAEDKQSSESG